MEYHMKKAFKAYVDCPLILRIAVGLVIGIVLGLWVPAANFVTIFGDIFVGALKAIAPLLVFVLVIASLASAGQGIGKRFRTVILFYMSSTFLAAATAVVASYLFKVTVPLADAVDRVPPSGLGEVFRTLLSNMVMNPLSSIMSGNYIGVLTWAVIFGLALRESAETTKTVLENVSDALSTAIKLVINCAPFGIMGLVFATVSSTGLSAFASYIHVILVLVCCMFFVALVINPIIVFICTRENPYPLVFKCLKVSGIMAFFTRSSAANIPVNMSLCEDLGLDKEKYSVSIPLGATINMAGASITISVLTLAAAHTLGVSVDFPTAFLLSFVSTLAACGASGVAGGSLLLIPMACSLFGISNDIAMQVVGIGFIIGVIQDSCETALNSSSDVLFTAAAELRSRRLAKKG